MLLPAKITITITACSVFTTALTAYAAIYLASNGSENISLWVGGVAALALLAVLNFAILTARLSSRRVQFLQLQLQELAKGNTGFVVREDISQDEFADMATSIETIRQRMADQNRLPLDADDELKALNIKTANETDISLASPDIQANSLKNTAEIMRVAASQSHRNGPGDWDDI